MSSTYKRKADDNRIIELNNIGLSLCGIADRLGVHHTTITYRLRALGIQATDTRRAFMEDIFNSLTSAQQQWLIDELGPGFTIKDLIRSLILKEFINQKAST